EADLYKKEKKTRFDFPREQFLKMVEEFAQNSHDTIINQLKRLGASADWSREAYTLDQPRTLAVRMAFKRMYDDGLIYRGAKIVNWDPKLKTTVSDDEIQYVEQKDPFYSFQYGPFVIGTVRPETKFGDKYVVMHPADERYRQYKHGQKIELEWINGPLTATVIKDEAADMEFGSGVMTITPAHSAIDFDIAQRHGLDVEQIIDDRGVLLPIAGEFAGQHIKKARAAIVEKLKAKGLLVKTDENYTHNIATNSRGGGIIEPQIKEQWFVDVNREFPLRHSEIPGINAGDTVSLKRLMRHVVQEGLIKIIPDHFEKTYFHWIDNLRDWCISRQIWYGHRIPVWYKDGQTYCGVEAPQGEGWQQDSDTLDTWFSSGLWTFSTLGWPQSTKDLQFFHPTDVMETGYDILFFWVARMILMTTYHTGQIPFRTVFLHGLVRDKDRQKMSKSKGNVIDPLGVIDAYGTDALRFALVFSTAAGSDIPLAEDKIKGMKHFGNKLWNIARFILSNIGEPLPTSSLKKEKGAASSPLFSKEGPVELTQADIDILKKLDQTVKNTTAHLEAFRLHEAAQELYQFVWRELADVYIEASKEQLKHENLKANTLNLLLYNLITIIKLLHPFMPFITEELWGKLQAAGLLPEKGLLLVSGWPN
ncbi:MAG TPA: valine--tRNA ligase, partial [Patescibacteria group bacterium]|nr:valine--tRNA ligase [Patescibacteria group bacterium]